jgi:tetratricopeptide (TPR) repeat protein
MGSSTPGSPAGLIVRIIGPTAALQVTAGHAETDRSFGYARHRSEIVTVRTTSQKPPSAVPTLSTQPTQLLENIRKHFEGLDHVRRGVCMLNAGRNAAAAEAFRQAQRLGLADRGLPALLASSILQSDPQSATDELAGHLENDARNILGRIRYALAAWTAGRSEEAIAALREALRRNPECAELHYQLGTLLAAMADYDEAELRFTQALNIDREHTEARIAIAMCYGACGEPLHALAHLERAQQHRPHDARIGLLLSQAAIAATQAGHMVRPRAAMPSDTAADDPTGREELARVIEAEPEFVDAFLGLQQGIVDQRVFTMLLETLHDVLARRPEHAELHLHCGRILARLGRSDEAIAENERAVAIDPKCVRALIELGKLYRQTDRRADATSRLEQAVRAGAEYADVYFLLGNLYREQGYVQKARTAYRRALTINHRYEAASMALDAMTVA